MLNTLDEYIRWIGEFDFRQYPFRDADAMVLCVISYFDLKPVFAQSDAPAVSDCLPMIESGEAKIQITGGDMGNSEIFRQAAKSKRFGQLRMSDYVDILQEEPAVQFSAVTFRSGEDFTFAAFRGTDSTLAGWKEDFMISFTKTEAQEMAASYAKAALSKSDTDRLYIAGHSKGGNLALYAGCMLAQEDLFGRVTQVYVLDGPGFCPEVMDTSLVTLTDAKTTRIIPQFDVIGKLFEPKLSNTRIVKSRENGLLQHSLATWLVDCGDLAEVPENDPAAGWLNDALASWVADISQEDRPVFIDELFDALGAGGTQDLDSMGPEEFEAALLSLAKKSKLTRRTLAQLPKKMIAEELPQNVTKENSKWLWITSNGFFRGGVLIAAGIAAMLSSGRLLEIAATLVILTIAGLQLYLTVKRIAKNGWSLEGMRDKVILTIALLGVCATAFFKEEATFFIGSAVFGILFLVLSYISGVKAKEDKYDKYMRWLHTAESIVCGLYGASFLIIPKATVYGYAISIGVSMIADGVLRIVRTGILAKKSKEKEAAQQI